MFFAKKNRLHHSLVVRLTLIYSTVFTLIALVVLGIIYQRIQYTALERLDGELLEDASTFTLLVREFGYNQAVERFLGDKGEEASCEEFFRIVTQNGQVLTSTDTSKWALDSFGMDWTAEAGAGAQYHIVKVSTDDGEGEGRVVTLQIDMDRFLQLAESLEEIGEYLGIFKNLLTYLTVFLLLATVVVGWLIARWSLLGFCEMSDTARQIAGGDYARRVDASSQLLEMREFATSFNIMVDRLTSLMNSMKEVNNSIAHDLRSPLARIRGIAEMTLIDDPAKPKYREMASSTIEECDQLLLLINTMLDITETEAGMAASEAEVFNLGELILYACELFTPVADEKNITLCRDIPDGLLFTGDRRRMQRICTNLLENALKYTMEEGEVRISVSKALGGVTVEVADTGIGIASTDLPHIYDRFFRCDKSRGGDGFGLGLSLAKAYVESMNGAITTWSELGKGSIFTLHFRDQQ